MTRQRGWRGSVAALSVAVLAMGLSTAAAATPTELDATIVWVAGDHFYLAARDTSMIERGMTLSVMSKRRVVATAEVEGVYQGELARARITSGSLAGERKLDRLRVFSDRPPRTAWPLLRVGYPSTARRCLLFACDSMSPRRAPPGAYRPLASDAGGERWVRVSAAHGTAWPDTLVVRWFDDVADQEIAIERGDIDAGVFWPGELSPRMRGDDRWSWGYGARPGVVAMADSPSASHAPSLARLAPEWAALNRRLFLGDLMPLISDHEAPEEITYQPVPPDNVAVPEQGGATPRIVADPSLPGADIIQRWLDRSARGAQASATDTVRLVYLERVTERRGAEADTAANANDNRAPTPRPLFSIRCPVVWTPPVDSQVRALGADAIVDWMRCGPAASPVIRDGGSR